MLAGGRQLPGESQKSSDPISNLDKLPFPQLGAVLAAPGLQSYLVQCMAPRAAPLLTPFSAWALRHEYHLQYLALALAQKAVGSSMCWLLPHPSPWSYTLPTSSPLSTLSLSPVSLQSHPYTDLLPAFFMGSQYASPCQPPVLRCIMPQPWPC